MLLQEIDIHMEEIELLRLLNFVQLFLALLYQRTESDEEKKLLSSFRVDTFTHRESVDLLLRYYFEVLSLSPIKATLSFLSMPAVQDEGTPRAAPSLSYHTHTHTDLAQSNALTPPPQRWRTRR